MTSVMGGRGFRANEFRAVHSEYLILFLRAISQNTSDDCADRNHPEPNVGYEHGPNNADDPADEPSNSETVPGIPWGSVSCRDGRFPLVHELKLGGTRGRAQRRKSLSGQPAAEL